MAPFLSIGDDQGFVVINHAHGKSGSVPTDCARRERAVDMRAGKQRHDDLREENHDAENGDDDADAADADRPNRRLYRR